MNRYQNRPRAATLQNPLLGKNHVHATTRKQERHRWRRQLKKGQWDDRSAAALR